jgi:hypothetical protein
MDQKQADSDKVGHRNEEYVLQAFLVLSKHGKLGEGINVNVPVPVERF